MSWQRKPDNDKVAIDGKWRMIGIMGARSRGKCARLVVRSVVNQMGDVGGWGKYAGTNFLYSTRRKLYCCVLTIKTSPHTHTKYFSSPFHRLFS